MAIRRLTQRCVYSASGSKDQSAGRMSGHFLAQMAPELLVLIPALLPSLFQDGVRIVLELSHPVAGLSRAVRDPNRR